MAARRIFGVKIGLLVVGGMLALSGCASTTIEPVVAEAAAEPTPTG